MACQALTIEAFHRAGVQAHNFRCDHQILTGKRRAPARPPEQVSAREGWQSDRFEGVQDAKERNLQRAKKVQWTGRENDAADSRCANVFVNFALRKAGLAHPRSLQL